MLNQLGFMQGRLSPMQNNKIQAFPHKTWTTEFILAQSLGLTRMEWTLDDPINENPLLDPQQHSLIQSLCQKYNIKISGLTGDCFMQKPFWKSSDGLYKKLCIDFINILRACTRLEIPYIVVPLVDNGSIKHERELELLLSTFSKYQSVIATSNVHILFESDMPPLELLNFIKKFPSKYFGINYDIGNSSALGYDTLEELNAYYPYIKNVHIKDRVLNGTTVNLGTGNANIPLTLRELVSRGYTGSLIFQAARAPLDKNDIEQMQQYINYILDYCY
ncbi:sugar phosphate isomerase/epimerase [Synechococcus sp. UW179B]|uniref:sugar phosphate isomerase/epimerase family protein n=1 Tax=Synechococcus sp. UW179B TaxID=2575516 RepID=UPI000E0F788D|nr:TIM barrel protein [Synechococcus sp. UW179B]